MACFTQSPSATYPGPWILERQYFSTWSVRVETTSDHPGLGTREAVPDSRLAIILRRILVANAAHQSDLG